MAASLDDLKSQIEAAERDVHAADARASEASRALKAHWRARGPKFLIGSASALLAWQLLRGGGRPRSPGYVPTGNAFLRTIGTVLRVGGPQLMTIISALVAGVVAKNAKKPLATAPAVDLDRYVGTWYEIARMPEKHEKDCASDVMATYERTPDGGLRVTNRCRRANGTMKRATGRVEIADPQTNAKLKVSFAPQLLDVLPFVWSDYYIIDVASDYSTAVVGTPDRAHLWLLSREASVSEEVRSSFIAKALGQGFDTSQLIYPTHAAGSAGNREQGVRGSQLTPSAKAGAQFASDADPTLQTPVGADTVGSARHETPRA